MSKDSDLDRISKNLSKSIKKGGQVCVLGWKSSNHNDFTRSLEQRGWVTFVDLSGDNSIKSLPQQPVVIFTRFISHEHTKQLKSQKIPMHPHPLTMGLIRKILREIEPHFRTKPAQVHATSEATIATTPVPRSLSELEETILEKGNTLDKYDKFAAAFAAKAAERTDGLVGARKLSEILSDLQFEEKAPVLVKAGWITPFTQPGKNRIGWYEVGPKMQERLQKKDVSEEPVDALDKAVWLLDKEPEYRNRHQELLKQVKHWEEQLRRIEAAKELLKKIEAL